MQARDEAQLDNAGLNLKRFNGLAGRQYASKQTLDTQKALVAQLQGSVRNDRAPVAYASVQLGFASIVSPVDGVTGLRLIDEGNMVRATDATGIVTVASAADRSGVHGFRGFSA